MEDGGILGRMKSSKHEGHEVLKGKSRTRIGLKCDRRLHGFHLREVERGK